MRFSVFFFFAVSGFSADNFADFNNPDRMTEIMKNTIIPMMKTEFENLNHQKMHEEMEEDKIQMKFVDRGFDFCVGEEKQKMSFEEDLKCSKKIFDMIVEHVPEGIPTDNFVQNQDQGKIILNY